MKNLLKETLKVTVYGCTLALAYAVGERVEKIVEEDESISQEDKALVTTVSCIVAGSSIGLIGRAIIKRL